jgi:hypothetical protein
MVNKYLYRWLSGSSSGTGYPQELASYTSAITNRRASSGRKAFTSCVTKTCALISRN